MGREQKLASTHATSKPIRPAMSASRRNSRAARSYVATGSAAAYVQPVWWRGATTTRYSALSVCQFNTVGCLAPIAALRSVRPSAVGIGFLPQRWSLASASLTCALSGTAGLSCQLGSMPLARTSPCSSSSTPTAPAPTRSVASSTIFWTVLTLERPCMTPMTLPLASLIGAARKTEVALLEVLPDVLGTRAEHDGAVLIEDRDTLHVLAGVAHRHEHVER